MYISLWENSRGHPDNVSFMQFSTKIYGFEQKDSQGFENSYNSYEQYPLEKFFIFTIYQNYTLALMHSRVKLLIKKKEKEKISSPPPEFQNPRKSAEKSHACFIDKQFFLCIFHSVKQWARKHSFHT